ncbi:MAG: DUF6249 domain-containing protein [Paludibacter sp.]|nr:DUF6249 domain-containing protein [Paludibacter sp.]
MKRIVFIIAVLVFISGIYTRAAESQKDSIVRKEIKVVKNDLPADTGEDSMILQKLSPEQIIELKKQEAEVEISRIAAQSKQDMPLNAPAIVLIVLMPFVFVIIVLIIMNNIRNKESQRRHDIYMKSLEMGQSVPEHFFDEPKKTNPSSNLKKGILWFSAGLSVLIYFLIVGETSALILGIVPAFVGAGFLLVHILEKPKKEHE